MSPPRARLAPLAAGLLLAGLAWGRLAPTFGGWHQEDDFRSMRWVIEWRDQPWAALTELHSVHDHIRPATLVATWAGAWLSNGAWWGVHAVHVALVLAALAAVVALGARLVGSPWGGLVAGLLVVASPGFGSLPTWNAWICSAGELACGLWGLVALDGALRRGRAPLLAGGLFVLAGLFKEPGWLVYPCAGAVMALVHWRRGALDGRDPAAGGQHRALLGLVPVAIGLGGLALTWHPTNLFRAEVAPLPLPQRLVEFLGGAGATIVDRWPNQGVDPTGAGLGVPLLLASLGLAALLVEGRRALLALALALAVAGLLLPAWAATALLLLAGAVALLRRPGPEPVLLVLPLAIMAPFPGPNQVQVLAGGVGLALVAAIGVVRLGRLAPSWAPPLLALLVLSPSARLAVRKQGLAPRGFAAGEARDQAAFQGIAGVAARLGAPEVATGGERETLVLAPLLGLRVVDAPPPWQPAVELPGPTWLPASAAAPAWTDGDLLGQLPPLLGARAPKVRPGGRISQRPDIDGLLLELTAGDYLLGLALSQPSDKEVVLLEARDRCEGSWSVAGAGLPSAEAVAVVVRLGDGCGPLSVTRARPELPGRPFLVPLDRVREDLRGAVVDERIVDVGVAAGGVVPGLVPDR